MSTRRSAIRTSEASAPHPSLVSRITTRPRSSRYDLHDETDQVHAVTGQMSQAGRGYNSLPGGVPEWPKGTGCKPVGSAYGGSNPPAPIRTDACRSVCRSAGIRSCARRGPSFRRSTIRPDGSAVACPSAGAKAPYGAARSAGTSRSDITLAPRLNGSALNKRATKGSSAPSQFHGRDRLASLQEPQEGSSEQLVLCGFLGGHGSYLPNSAAKEGGATIRPSPS
jgi:hypothetical protein